MRRLAIVRAIYGVFLFVASGTVIERVTGERSRSAVLVGRVVGTRHVLQALTLGRTRSRGWMVAGVLVDALHALSMAALAAPGTRYRRVAALDAAAAGLWAVSGWLVSRDT